MVNFIKRKDKLKSFYEQKRTFLLKNPKERFFGFVKGESTAETDGQKRCDYVICFDMGPDDRPQEPSNYLFVELKGSDNEKALQQIVSTIYSLKQEGCLTGKKVDCFVVSGSCPSVKTKDQILKAKFPYRKPPYCYALTFRTKQAEYEIK